MWVYTIICSCLLGQALGYSIGAPLSACRNSALFPLGHNVDGQNGPSPYTVTPSVNQYTGGDTITVEISGTGTQIFKGFAILALIEGDDNGDPQGSFAVNDTAENNLVQTRCGSGSNTGLTHTQQLKDNPRNSIVLKWTAPPGTGSGNIVFHTTIVEEQLTFWAKQKTLAIWDGVSAMPTTTTTPSGPIVITDPPAIASPTINSCGGDKSCYRDCDGATCDFVLTWRKQDAGSNMVKFEMFGSLADNQGYIALGLATTDKMSDVSIIACVADPNRASRVEMYYASAKVPLDAQSTGPLNSGASEAAIKTDGGARVMSCSFTYDNDIAKANTDKWKDLDAPLFAFIARGAYTAGGPSQHNDIPKISPAAQQFMSDEFVDVGGARINMLIKAHACIMVLAWVFCASIGLILARYYKVMWVEEKACGQKVWFSYHRALMLSAMFLTIIGFILILIDKDGNFVTEEKLPNKAHPIIGLIAIICALFNPLLAAFRCHPEDSKRPIFNWVHWFFGTVAHVFAVIAVLLGTLFTSKATLPGWLWYVVLGDILFHAIMVIVLEIYSQIMDKKSNTLQPKGDDPAPSNAVVAIFLGMLFTEKAALPSWLIYIMMVFCLFHVCVEFILEIHQCCMYDKNRDRQEEFQMTNKGESAPQEPQYSGRGFKCCMLAIYLVVVSLLTVAIVAIIAVWGNVEGTK